MEVRSRTKWWAERRPGLPGDGLRADRVTSRVRISPHRGRVHRGGVMLALVAGCCLWSAGSARAQEPATVSVDGGSSHILPPSGGFGDASPYLFLGARLTKPASDGALRLRASLHGGESPADSAGSWAQGSAELSWRGKITRRIRPGIHVEGSGFVVGEPQPYRTVLGRVEPELRFLLGSRASLTLSGQAAAGRSRVTVSTESGAFIPPPFRGSARSSRSGPGPSSPPGPDPPDGSGEVELRSDLWSVGGSGLLRVYLGRLDVRVGGGHLRTEIGSYPHARAGVGLPLGTGRLSLGASIWDTPFGTEAAGTLSLTLDLGGGWVSNATAGRSSPDPVYGSQSVTRGSAVMSWTTELGGASPPFRIEPGSPPAVVFRLEAKGAESVHVLGEFTDWRRVALRRSGGRWTARMPVEPGVYRFGFLVDGRWRVPDGAVLTVEDGFGRENAVLWVPEE